MCQPVVCQPDIAGVVGRAGQLTVATHRFPLMCGGHVSAEVCHCWRIRIRSGPDGPVCGPLGGLLRLAGVSALRWHIHHHCRSDLLGRHARLLRVAGELPRNVGERDALPVRKLDIHIATGQARVRP